ncbi:ROK family glucokinase [Halobacillus sp. ACCC02827]|uniref:ROK family glucokinase n=1 Tax=Bacillaceae TaxID=186817 RepID=UPI0002A523EF|nr:MULTISPECIES: ROK family glucokinase [Bacillaceae]ELK46220.1 ROK family protein [Halobacillus sp. BAB-2008]QHT47160.1 ROK family glucokinase [Bacillus sp. SB49]WJE14389.1 ROK family glucokinase [Halobacillus sp. ACCC02827]
MTQTYYIGADIGGTTVKLAVIKEDGDILTKWEIPTNTTDMGASIPADIAEAIASKLQESGIDREQVAGIGAGAPGFVDTETGFIHEAVNIGWKDFDFGMHLKELTGLPVWVDNDANLAALGENWLGAGQGCKELIAVTIGTGVGGGIIANGNILNGANGTAAELGHVTVLPSGGAPCNCGKTGCLETETSATGIVRKATIAANKDKTSILNDLINKGELSAKAVFEAAANKDASAAQVVHEVTETLGMAIANLAIAINPEKIVIGGGVSKAGDILLKPLEEAYRKYALKRTAQASSFGIAQLGNDAGVIGGAYLVKKNR